MSEVDPGRFGESTLDDIRSSVVDVDSYNVDVWDSDESKSSGYNVGIFDDVDVAGDDPNRVTTDSNNLESSTYSKHVESRGAYALRGSGPPRMAHEKDDKKTNMTAGYDEDDERKSDVIDTEKYNIDPMVVTGKEGRSLNRVSNDMDLGSNTNFDVVGGTNAIDIIHVPKSNVRTRKHLTHKGWIKRRGGYGIFGGWKRQFLSLWQNTILYFHRDDVSSREFYNGTKSKNNAKGEINLRNIVGVREASKGGLPGNSRGIELVSSSGKITTICPEGNRNVFMSWLNALRDIIGKLNLERYRRTRDREYRRDVSEVDPGRFGESTLDDIRSSVVDVDSYNVDIWDSDELKVIWIQCWYI